MWYGTIYSTNKTIVVSLLFSVTPQVNLHILKILGLQKPFRMSDFSAKVGKSTATEPVQSLYCAPVARPGCVPLHWNSKRSSKPRG